MRSILRRSDWLWAAALLLAVSLHFWFPELGTGTARDTFSPMPQGKKAFYLLAQRRLSVQRNFDPLTSRLSELESGDTICLLGPARPPTDHEWDALLQWVQSGGSLLIAARQDEVAVSIESLGIKIVPILEAEPAVENGHGHRPENGIQTRLASGGELRWDSSAAVRVTGSKAVSLVEYEGTRQAVLQPVGRGRVVVVASDFVFTNESLLHGDNSVLAFRLLQTAGTLTPNPSWKAADAIGGFTGAGGEGEVYFDESLNASGTPKVVGLLLHPPLRPLTVQLLIGLVLFGWWESRRFGPLLPEMVSARHNIVDHTDAVGSLRYRLGDGSGAVRSYLRQLFGELCLKSFKGREERVLNPIALRMGETPETVRGLLREASRAARSGRLDRRTAGRLIRQLVEFRRAAVRTKRDER